MRHFAAVPVSVSKQETPRAPLHCPTLSPGRSGPQRPQPAGWPSPETPQQQMLWVQQRGVLGGKEHAGVTGQSINRKETLTKVICYMLFKKKKCFKNVQQKQASPRQFCGVTLTCHHFVQ